MPQTVEVPGLGVVEFPDDMTPAAISGVLKKRTRVSEPPQYFPETPPGPEQGPPEPPQYEPETPATPEPVLTQAQREALAFEPGAVSIRPPIPPRTISTTAGGPPLSVSPGDPFLPLKEKAAFDLGFAPLDPESRIDVVGLMPEVKKEDTMAMGMAKTALQNAAGFPEFFTSDAGISTLALGGIPGVRRLVGAYWAHDLITSAYKQARESTDNWDKLTDAQKGQAIVNFAVTSGLAAGAAGLGLGVKTRTVSPKALGETVARIPSGAEGAATAIKVLEQAKAVPPMEPVLAPPPMAPRREEPTPTPPTVQAAQAMQAGVSERLEAGKAAPAAASEAASARAQGTVEAGRERVEAAPVDPATKPPAPVPEAAPPASPEQLSKAQAIVDAYEAESKRRTEDARLMEKDIEGEGSGRNLTLDDALRLNELEKTPAPKEFTNEEIAAYVAAKKLLQENSPQGRFSAAQKAAIEKAKQQPAAPAAQPETWWSSTTIEPGKAMYFSNLKSDADAYSVGRQSRQFSVSPKKTFDPASSTDKALVSLFDELGGMYEAPQNPKFIKALKKKGYDSVSGGETGYGGESKWMVVYDTSLITEKGAADATKEGQVQGSVQPERVGTEAQRVSSETGAGDSVRAAAPKPEAATVPQAPGAQARDVVLEPWQMTKAEWAEDTRRKLAPSNSELKAMGFSGKTEPNMDRHYWAVKHALEAGKPVPPEVIADYPDLAEQAPQGVTPPAERSVLAAWRYSDGTVEAGKPGEIHADIGTKTEGGNGRIHPKTGQELPDGQGKFEAGFITNLGRFVDRDEAYRLGMNYEAKNIPKLAEQPATTATAPAEPSLLSTKKGESTTGTTETKSPTDVTAPISKAPGGPEMPSVGAAAAAPGGIPRRPAIEQLADAFAAAAPAKQRAAQLVREAFDFGHRAGAAKDLLSRALTGLADSSRAVWAALSKFDKPDELLQAKGVLSAELETRGWRVREFARNVRRAIPDVRRREAIAKWIDAGGDDARLQLGEAATKPEFRRAYRDARNLTPDEIIQAQNIQNFFEQRLQEAIDADVLEHGLSDYIHRIYPKDSAVRNRALAYVQSGILSKNPSLAKKRFYEWDYEAEAAGLRPVQDAVPRITDYETSLSKAIAAREFVRKLMDMRAPDGRPIIGVKGVGIPIEDASGVRTGTVIKPLGDFRKANDPTDAVNYRGDYKVKEYPSLSKWKWVGTDTDGKPIFLQGDVAIHPAYVSRMEALLEPSHVRYGSHEKLAKAGRFALGASSVFKQTMLDLSGFHQVQIALHAMEHRVMPWGIIKDIDFENPKVRGLLEGGVTLGGEFHDANMGEGLFGKSLSQHVPILGQVAESYHSWLFQSFIPRVKMTMALHALERNRARYARDIASGRMTETDLNHLTANQANAAFGELNYTMLERNKTVQDIARLAFLAPDFLEARGRFVGQALTKYGTEQRVALALGAITMWVLARAMNKIVDDQYHFEPENAFSLVRGNHAYSLRTVQGDVLHLLDKPLQFWLNRLNPLYSRTLLEMVFQRDAFGRKRTIPEVAADTIKNIQPISTRFSREQKLWESLGNAFGFTNRRWNDVDKAFKLAGDWKKEHGIQERGEFIYDPDKDVLRPLKLALNDNDEAGAVKEIRKLFVNRIMPKAKLDAYFQRFAKMPFSGSQANEGKFMSSLSKDEKATVENARKHRYKIGMAYRDAMGKYIAGVQQTQQP